MNVGGCRGKNSKSECDPDFENIINGKPQRANKHNCLHKWALTENLSTGSLQTVFVDICHRSFHVAVNSKYLFSTQRGDPSFSDKSNYYICMCNRILNTTSKHNAGMISVMQKWATNWKTRFCHIERPCGEDALGVNMTLAFLERAIQPWDYGFL